MIDTERIARLFKEAGYQWRFSDGLRVPTSEEINKTVVAAIGALEDAEENTQIEIGRLLVKKREGFYDVFVHLADYHQ